jgi:hypothetical protein
MLTHIISVLILPCPYCRWGSRVPASEEDESGTILTGIHLVESIGATKLGTVTVSQTDDHDILALELAQVDQYILGSYVSSFCINESRHSVLLTA